MKRRLLLVCSAALLTLVGAAATFAGQPANPGCFGQDRAAWIHANGGSTWGHIAADRGSTNGDQNRAYKTLCGGDPAP